MTCSHCGADTTNGLALCETCRGATSYLLGYLQIYLRNLSRWQPGRAGTRQVPGSREPTNLTTPHTDRVSDALDETGNDLTAWAQYVIEDRPGHLARVAQRILTMNEDQSLRLLCAYFDRHLVNLSTTPWIGEFVRAVIRHEETLRLLTEDVVPGWYAGSCRRCGTATYVLPGITWVTCAGCGTATAARDHLEIVIDEARGWLARPKALAEAAVALIDTEQSVPRLYDRIRKWAERGRIQPVRATARGYGWDEQTKRIVVIDEEVGHPRYRFGEVLAALFAEGATRLDTTKEASAC